MKNFIKIYAQIETEQEEYVQNIKDIIYRILESKGIRQTKGGIMHRTSNILPFKPQLGKEFYCETGTSFSFNVRIINGYIEAFGTVPGKSPVKMITKKWFNIKKMEKEFFQIFGQCFYKHYP